MKALDLFCGAGGATQGLLSAGFDTIVGVDSKPQPRYVGNAFIQQNALSLDYDYLRSFDFIWASPPCQSYVAMCDRSRHPDLVAPTRAYLQAAEVPWIIENVPQAPLFRFITLCGTMDEFPNLRVFRHRRFEFSDSLLLKQPHHVKMSDHPPVYSFDRRAGRSQGLNEWENYVTVAGNNCSLGAMSDAMEIYWMTRPEIAQAVPPAYASYLGKQVLAQLSKPPALRAV